MATIAKFIASFRIFQFLHYQHRNQVQKTHCSCMQINFRTISEIKMPRRRRGGNIGPRSRQARAVAAVRANENDAQREHRLTQERERSSVNRSQLVVQPRRRTAAQRIRRNFTERVQNIANRPNVELYMAAFDYDSDANYRQHNLVQIGQMDQVCAFCRAKKFPNETAGICCAGGKVKLPELEQPPEPLLTLISNRSPESQHFLKYIQAYNNCFQMTSFGATQIIRHGYMPTFKVNDYPHNDTHTTMTENENENYSENENDSAYENENDYEMQDITTTNLPKNSALQIQGQIYHQAGSLLPFADADYQFLQIYFIGNDQQEADRRCGINSSTKRHIILEIQAMLHANNELVRMFKTAIDRMPSDDHQIIIRPDKAPPTEHSRRFNAPTIDDVAIVIVGEQFQRRDIVLHRRNEQLMRVPETHRS